MLTINSGEVVGVMISPAASFTIGELPAVGSFAFDNGGEWTTMAVNDWHRNPDGTYDVKGTLKDGSLAKVTTTLGVASRQPDAVTEGE